MQSWTLGIILRWDHYSTKNIHSGKKGGKGKKGAKEEEDAGWKMPKSEYFDDVGREITTQKDVWRNRIVYAPWFIFN